jgi:hypothetical protein
VTLFGSLRAFSRYEVWFSARSLGALPEGLCMDGNIPDHVDEYRAAVLLGMPQSELRRYSAASGLGHVEKDGNGQKVVFTYEELRRICLLVAQSSK